MTFATKEQKNYNFQDFEDDEDISDDEVFVGNQKRSSEEENGVKKPLMAPRRKCKSDKLHTQVRRGPPLRAFCMPMCCVMLAVGAILGLIALVIILVNTFTEQMGFQEIALDDAKENINVVGCTNFQMQDVWVKNFPKLITETAFRLNDVNGDGIHDVILGFGTGADGYNVPSVVCDVYFEGQHPCFGGLLALDGKSGNEIWRHYSDHEIFSVNCNEDLNGDGIKDCLGGGRAGVFQAVSGKDGKLLWNFGPQEAKNDIMNVYTGQFIADSDGDDIPDVLVIHGGDPLAEPGSTYRLTGRIIILSGKDGQVLQWVGVPDQRESYYSPQIITHPDGTELVIFGTGGETHPGGLWYIPLNHLLKGDIKKARLIYHDNHKGVMTPPVLADINGDGVEDIIMAMFNSTVIAFDGFNFRQIWNYSFPMSESYNTPAAGYFNADDIPDFLVKYQHGPGFPIYYYSQTTILDGKTGRPLLVKSIKDTIGAQSSGLTISVEGTGNSIFLYWTSDCKGHEGESQQTFEFVKGTNVHEQSRSDFCQLRFNSQLINRMYAINRHIPAPGFPLYESERRKQMEYNNSVNTSAMAQEYLATHPDVLDAYQRYNNENTISNYQDTRRKTKPDHALKNNGRLSNKIGKSGYVAQGPPRMGVARGNPQPSVEYEEDVPYLEPHTVRKHGRFKSKHRNMQTQRSDNVYEDDSTSQRTTKNHWPLQMTDTNGENYGMDSVNRYPEQHFGDMDYNYYGNVDPSYRYQAPQRYPEESQDSPWYTDYNYGGTLKRNRGKNHKFRTRSTKSSKRAKRQTSQSQNRFARHVGPHDMDGIQRLISTGTLAPAWISDGHNVDVIFATYWFFPSKTQAILPQDRDCIQQKMAEEAERFKPSSKYYGMDHDAYEETATRECTTTSGSSPHSDNRTFQSQSDYDPFNIHMGQMTVYRLRLRCDCQGDMRVERAGRHCGKILPFEEQGWAAYMGTNGDGHFIPKKVN